MSTRLIWHSSCLQSPYTKNTSQRSMKVTVDKTPKNQRDIFGEKSCNYKKIAVVRPNGQSPNSSTKANSWVNVSVSQHALEPFVLKSWRQGSFNSSPVFWHKCRWVVWTLFSKLLYLSDLLKQWGSVCKMYKLAVRSLNRLYDVACLAQTVWELPKNIQNHVYEKPKHAHTEEYVKKCSNAWLLWNKRLVCAAT